ncbi:MAG: hypothetical protein M3680_05115 [Myxococcota bacterium]|nr:hypothetical protein [Myxococcota bacterium]
MSLSLSLLAALGACGDNLAGSAGGLEVADVELMTLEDVPVSRGVPVIAPADAELTIAVGTASHGTVTLAGTNLT